MSLLKEHYIFSKTHFFPDFIYSVQNGENEQKGKANSSLQIHKFIHIALFPITSQF